MIVKSVLKPDHARDSGQSAGLRAYAPPTLTVYGSVTALTAGGGSHSTEFCGAAEPYGQTPSNCSRT